MSEKTGKNSSGISCFTLTMITAALFMTLQNMPMMAQTGMQMFFLNFITVFAFIIPIALVSAELATGWPKNGVYHWVEAAFNQKLGFFSVWLQWANTMFGMVSILAYVVASFAYAINPDLGSNRYFIASGIILIYWLATWANFHGDKFSGRISSFCLLTGVLLPTLLLIGFGFVYASMDTPHYFNTSPTLASFIPSLADSNSWVLFLTFVFGFVGIEVSANHAPRVINVQKNYPRAIFLAAVFGFLFTLLGASVIAMVLPASQITIINGAIQAISVMLQYFNLSMITPVLACLIAFGAAGQVSTWIVGPIKGIEAAGKAGCLPSCLLKQNRYKVPTRLLLIQATIISLVALSFLMIKSINLVFLILPSIAVALYAIMYCIMFITAIRLRYTHPEVKRSYTIPGGKPGIFILAGMGFITGATCFFIGFVPPNLGGAMSTFNFELLKAGAVVIVCYIPFIIMRLRHRLPQYFSLSPIPQNLGRD